MTLSLFALLFLWSALPWLVSGNFTFTHNALTECDNVQISWTGGSGVGYYLSLIPDFDFPRNISIQSTDVNGTFSTPVPFNVSTKLVLSLSDSTGFASGGTTTIQQVGQSLGGVCNTTTPDHFVYGTPNSLNQCQPYLFNEYSTGVQPLTIFGVIPGGDSFVLNPPLNSNSFTWVVDVYNGTQIIFLMVDANLRQGGSFLDTVTLTGDTSCINASSPSSTIDASASASASATSTGSAVPTTPASSKTGAIAGSVLGALIFLAVLITLGLFFLRQRQEKKNAMAPGGSEFRRTSRPMQSELDLTGPFMSASTTPNNSTHNLPSSPPAHYQPYGMASRLPESANPFNHAPSTAPSSIHSPDVDPFMDRAPGPSGSRTPGQRKSAMSGLTGYTPSRYVLHTDAEDEDLAPNEDGVVELPPQYSASRPPAKGIPRTNSTTSS
ncbi:hypothetical protein B0H16DRAFT_1489753 [Mycena metata]|uniref:Uncharacterized protein n=1 Tax=Mycena metata TaxID=1033252 RepID=A0AAD7P3F5_9AGAR|nr:hypothetical protein B0H16DRAFT_1489753 [Mycena metata]